MRRPPSAPSASCAAAGIIAIAIVHIFLNAPAYAQQTPPPDEAASGSPSRLFEEVVVTASARNERLGDTAATVQVIGREEIETTSATTLTGVLAQYGLAFFSEWTP